MSTEGSFSRDEWNHLLRLFNIIEFLDVFLQPLSVEQESKAPCRRELRKGKSKKKPAVAKPVSACLVSKNLLRARQTSSLDSGDSCGPGNQKSGRISVSWSTGKPARGVQNPATNSQEWQRR